MLNPFRFCPKLCINFVAYIIRDYHQTWGSVAFKTVVLVCGSHLRLGFDFSGGEGGGF